MVELRRLAASTAALVCLLLSALAVANYLRGPDHRLHLYEETERRELELTPGESATLLVRYPRDLIIYLSILRGTWSPASLCPGESGGLVRHYEVELRLVKAYGSVAVYLLDRAACAASNGTSTYIDMVHLARGEGEEEVVTLRGGCEAFCAMVVAVERSRVDLAITRRVLSHVADYSRAFSWLYTGTACLAVSLALQVAGKVTIEDGCRELVLRLYRRNSVLSRVKLPRVLPFSVVATGSLAAGVAVAPAVLSLLLDPASAFGSPLMRDVFLDLMTRWLFVAWALLPNLIIFTVMVELLHRVLLAPVVIKYIPAEKLEDFNEKSSKAISYYKRVLLRTPTSYLLYASLALASVLVRELLIREAPRALQVVIALAGTSIAGYFVFIVWRSVRRFADYYEEYMQLERASLGLHTLLLTLWCAVFLNSNRPLLDVAWRAFWSGAPVAFWLEESAKLFEDALLMFNVFAESLMTLIPILVTAVYYGTVIVLLAEVKGSRKTGEFVYRSIIEVGVAVSSIAFEMLLELRHVLDYEVLWGEFSSELVEAVALSFASGYVYEIRDFAAKAIRLGAAGNTSEEPARQREESSRS